MGDASTFVIKGDVHAFVIGDGMGDAPAFVINRDSPLEMRISFTCIIGDAQKERVSPFYHKSERVSNINLTEMRQKEDHLLFTLL
jgi:hypothetical protein